MKFPGLTTAACLLFSAGFIFASAKKELTVREVINSATISSAPVRQGDKIPAGDVIQVGENSRAQLSWGKENTVRLGAKSALQLNEKSSSATLQSGSVLFENANGGRQIVIQHNGKEAIVTGEIGFANLANDEKGDSQMLVIGSISGTTRVKANGKTYRLKSGELLAFPATGREIKTQFDLAKQIKTSQLLNGFQSTLASQKQIQREAKQFVALRERGFIRTTDIANSDFQLSKATLMALDAGIGALAMNNVRTTPTRTLRSQPPSLPTLNPIIPNAAGPPSPLLVDSQDFIWERPTMIRVEPVVYVGGGSVTVGNVTDLHIEDVRMLIKDVDRASQRVLFEAQKEMAREQRNLPPLPPTPTP